MEICQKAGLADGSFLTLGTSCTFASVPTGRGPAMGGGGQFGMSKPTVLFIQIQQP